MMPSRSVRAPMRSVILLVLAILVLSPLAAASASLAQPTWTAGDSWTRATQFPRSDGTLVNGTLTDVVVGRESASAGGSFDAWNVTSYRQTSGEATSSFDVTWYRASDLAKLRVFNGGNTSYETTYSLDEPCRELQFPLEVGKTWATTCVFHGSDGNDMTIPSTWKVDREEDVTVPAGTFHAVILQQVEPSGYVSSWWWGAAACSFVKSLVTDPQGKTVESNVLTAYRCANAPAPATPTPASTPPASSTPAGSTPPSGTTPTTTSTSGAEPTPTTSGGDAKKSPGFELAGLAFAAGLVALLRAKRS